MNAIATDIPEVPIIVPAGTQPANCLEILEKSAADLPERRRGRRLGLRRAGYRDLAQQISKVTSKLLMTVVSTENFIPSARESTR
jgi:hypothetical protein